MAMELKYRPEIDGLRTIAVLAVIIYHSEIFFGRSQLLKGGFLGVDVFFVISGFLITSIIMREYLRTGKFSITNFYERRARRILPALFVVILVSLPFAWSLLQPSQIIDFSKSILSTLAFGSNFYWDSTLQEYGAESALLKPFLHTWSLAVEEQYYIIFPLILIGIYKWLKIHVIVLLTAGFLLSLQFAETMSTYDASFSFYMLPSRFWELLAGSLLANILYLHPQKENDALLNRTMPIFGLFLIVNSMIFTDFDANHPGFVTLMPVIGTLLIIWFANENDLVTQVLSSKLFVGIGLLSYSLYLWHYPIFAFGRFIDLTPSWHDKFQWVVLTFLLSVLTYFLIEKPFRDRARISRSKLFLFMSLAAIIAISVTTYWVNNTQVVKRSGGYLGKVLKDSNRIWVTQNNKKCHSGGGGWKQEFQLSESCIFEYKKGADYLIAIGDSHAASLSESLRVLAQENNLNFIQLTNAGCSHIMGLLPQTTICEERSKQLVSFLGKYPNSIIIYNSRVPLKLEMEKFDNHEGDKEANYKPVKLERVKKEFPLRSQAFINTLNELKSVSRKLVIVYPVPEQGFKVRDKLYTNDVLIKSKQDLPILSTSYEVFKTRVKRSYQTLDKVTGDSVYRVYPEYIFCRESIGRCIASEEDKIYFAGDNHVSRLGSNMIVKEVANRLNLKMLKWNY
jgi:peptidoglycan/LPS O-acetylase OafA/YrhL